MSKEAIQERAPLIDEAYPEISLAHLDNLTDRTGVIQHAIYSIPNRRTGYTTDDNSRALIVAVRHYEKTGSRKALQLVSTYLSFLHYAQLPNGRFHNFMSFDQTWLDGEGSEDCHGRTLWALGQCLAAEIHANVKEVAKELFQQGLWIPETCVYSRGQAYSILGLALGCRSMDDSDEAAEVLKLCADKLVQLYKTNATSEWPWFESYLTYSNALLPRALVRAYDILKDPEYLEIAETSWQFLESQCVIDGILQLIGCNGWYHRGKERAWFDQQPIDAMMMELAALDMYEVTGKEQYLKTAKISLDWFFGKNAVGVSLHDPVTGGCFDGLKPSGRNRNQGSESTIAGLLSQIEMAPYIKNGRALFIDD